MNKFTSFVAAHKVPILATTGIACGVAGVAWGMYNSIEYGDRIKSKFAELDFLRIDHENGERMVDGAPYTDEMYKQDRLKVIRDISRQFVKMYAGPGALMCASGACFLGAIGIQSRDLAILTTSFNTMSGLYEQYRSRVIEKIGEDEEQKLHLGLKEEVTTEKVVDEKTGKTKEVKKKILVQDKLSADIYTIYMSESTEYNPDNPDLCGYFIRGAQIAMNDQLQLEGAVSFNRALKALGCKPRKIGLMTGWAKDAPERGTGDGYVDFRACPIKREVNGKMIDDWILSPNVDGDISGSRYLI